MRLLIHLTVAALSLCLLTVNANADFTSGLIDVDFNFTPQSTTESGPAVIGIYSDIWNPESNFSAHTTGVMGLATGSPSNGVAYSLSGVTNALIGGTAFTSTPYSSLMNDGYTVNPGNTMAIAFNGLTAFQPYDLYLYSSFANPAPAIRRTTTFTISGTSLTAMALLVGAPNVFVEGNNYVHFSAQPANATGRISISVQGTGGPNYGPGCFRRHRQRFSDRSGAGASNAAAVCNWSNWFAGRRLPPVGSDGIGATATATSARRNSWAPASSSTSSI